MRQSTVGMLVDKNGADAKQVADNIRIIEIAINGVRVKGEDDAREFKAALTELDRLDEPGTLLVWIALETLLGKRSCFATANPETIERCHALASDLGATVRADADNPQLKAKGLTGMTLLFVSPPPSAQLQQMLQKMKTLAEGWFRRDGEVVPRFVLEFENGEFAEVVCPWGSRAEKHHALRGIKQKIREHGRLVRYGHVAEVWSSSDTDVTPTQSPNRRESLMIVASEPNAAPIGGMFEIKRHALSATPALGEWIDMSGQMQHSRHFDLFEDDDLAADARGADPDRSQGASP
jgi:hypothetical protein